MKSGKDDDVNYEEELEQGVLFFLSGPLPLFIAKYIAVERE